MNDNKWMVGFRRRSAVGVIVEHFYLADGEADSAEARRTAARMAVALGPRRYGGLLSARPGMGASPLATRLKHLERHDVPRRTTPPGYTDRRPVCV
ncbi:hypothetical protein [Streptomyces sp. NPDC005970]|uniref:hypothetical protein n=1 Tax=Streptomyces sp. NPDC005970 TaxID=3156723 RepID=UPI0033D8C980